MSGENRGLWESDLCSKQLDDWLISDPAEDVQSDPKAPPAPAAELCP